MQGASNTGNPSPFGRLCPNHFQWGALPRVTTILTSDPSEAAYYVRIGEVVAFPTETVYGLGGNALDANAIRKIFIAKKRPADNPLIVHVARLDAVERITREIPSYARDLMHTFFPGPLTLVLPRHPDIGAVVSGGLDTIGVRMPRHETARVFLEACAAPVAAPSANLSGKPSPTSWESVLEDLDGRIACILQSDRTDIGLESTVVDCTGEQPVILRTGAVSLEAIQKVVPDASPALNRPDLLARSPGTRYRHYAPSARVVLVESVEDIQDFDSAGYIGMERPVEQQFVQTRTCRDLTEYAYHLYDFFRLCDAAAVRVIYCQRVAANGLGAALLDRIGRAGAV